jgi:hypothetical protein
MITSSSLPSERSVCRIGLLERLPLRTPYPSIAARIIDIVRRLPRRQTSVIVDRTGAHAAYDMLMEKGLSPVGMTISGADSINWAGCYVTVPKMRLLTGLLSICYRDELKISKGLRDYAEFRRQLQNIGTMATDSGSGETWRARRGHDDLVIAVSMAAWHLENPGPNMAILEFYRRRAGVPLENYCVAVDFGQSVDNCAICVMSRTSAPAPEPGAVEPVEPAPGGAIADLPAPIQQPESTAPPPDLASPEWQHEVAEGQKALLRRQGFSSGGPLKATPTFPSISTATNGGSRSK